MKTLHKNKLKIGMIINAIRYKNFVGKYSAIIIVIITFISCNNGKERLLYTVTNNSGSMVKYEYDDENRIIKISEYKFNENIARRTQTFTYIGEDFIKIVEELPDYMASGSTTEFVKNGNKITVNYESFSGDIITNIFVNNSIIYLDNNGLPFNPVARWTGIPLVYTFQFQDGNLMKKSREAKSFIPFEIDLYTKYYKYDKKKSPFFYCKTPKWLLILNYAFNFGFVDGGSRNNIIEYYYVNGVKVEFKYEYDRAGFPIKRTTKYGDEEEYIIEYKYIKKEK